MKVKEKRGKRGIRRTRDRGRKGKDEKKNRKADGRGREGRKGDERGEYLKFALTLYHPYYGLANLPTSLPLLSCPRPTPPHSNLQP